MQVEDILKDIEDDEPACFDKIHYYVELLQEKDDQFMETPTDDSQQYILRNISKAEHEQIVENWLELRKQYDLPDELDSLARWRNNKCKSPNNPCEAARRFVLAYLARGLQRNLYQVFRHIMTTFGGSVKGAYSPAEEKVMKVCFEQLPQNCVSILSRVLHREPRGIYRRLCEVYNGTPDRTERLKLSLPVAKKLLKLLLKYTELPLEELKYKEFDTSVWVKVGEKMNHPYIYLKKLWYHKLHVQLFVKTNLKLNRVRKRAFKILRSSTYEVWTDIRWNDLVQSFPDGVTSGFLYKLCISVVAKIPDYKCRPLSEVIDQALVKFKKARNKCLNCLAVLDGELTEINYKHQDDSME